MKKIACYVSLSIILPIALFFTSTLPASSKPMPIPDHFPDQDDFSGEDIKIKNKDWNFDRSGGEGGEDYGKVLRVPEGYVAVGFKVKERSCISCVHQRPPRIAYDTQGALRYPSGVSVGVRIDTGDNPWDYVGPGGSYTGTATLMYVPYDVWLKALFEKGSF